MGQKQIQLAIDLVSSGDGESNWYGGRHYADKLVEDEKIRNYLKARLAKAASLRL